MMLIKKVYLVATLLMLAGCSLEHSLIIDMKDRGYSVDYIQSRDLDLIPFLYPSDLDRWTVLDSSEIELHHQRTFSYDEAFPSLFTINSIDENNSMMNNDIYTKIKDKEIVLKEPYQITSSNLFILKNYQFEGTFKSRRIENNYDKLINYYSGFMDDAELIVNGDDAPEKEYNSINAIFNQLIGFLYIEVINNSSIEFNQKGIYLNALKEWSSKPEILALINEDKIGLDGEQLSKILGLAEEYLNEVIDDSYADEVKDIWEELELEIYGTLFLLFNDFYIQINMPGDHVHHNADSVYQNTLLWNIDIDRFMSEDFKIFAKSRVLSKSKTWMLLLSLLIVLAFILKRKYSKS